MMFVFTFLLVVGLEIAVASNNQVQKPPPPEIPEEPDMCVGCDDKKAKEDEKDEKDVQQQLTVEIRIDPATGSVRYVIKGIVIDQ